MIKCAIAGGSVIDFKHYDSAYTERYMGLPKDNKMGYSVTIILYFKFTLKVFRTLLYCRSTSWKYLDA